MHTAHDSLIPDMTEGISVSGSIECFVFLPLANSIHPKGELALTAPPCGALCGRCWMFSHWSSIISLFQTQSGGNPLALAVLFIQSDLCLCVTMEKNKQTKTKFDSPLKLSLFFSPDHVSTVCCHWGVICPTPTHSDWSLSFDKSIIAIHRFSFRLVALPFKCQVGNSPIFSCEAPFCTAPGIVDLAFSACTVTLPPHLTEHPHPSVVLPSALFGQKRPSPPAPPTPRPSSLISVSHGYGTCTLSHLCSHRAISDRVVSQEKLLTWV